MPQVLVYVVEYFVAYLGVSTAVAYVITYAIVIAATVAAASAYSSAQRRKMDRALASLRDQASGLLVSVRDPIAPRRLLYGTRRLGGTTSFGSCTGVKNEFLHLIIAITGHEVDSIGDVYFSDEVIPLGTGGISTGRLAGLVRVNKHLGSDTQAADADLVSDDPSEWTTNHRLRGVSYIYVRVKFDQEKFPSGLPQISSIVRGKKIYDPRTSTTAWSDNPALCVRDYLMDQLYGLGCDASEIDDATVIAAANICDEAVPIAAGGTEKRYTCNGVVDSSWAPADALDALLSSMGGVAIYSGGKWRIYAAAWNAPVASFTMDDLRGPVTVQTADSLANSCNGVKGTFIDPNNGWQASDAPPVENSTYLSEDGGIKSWRDMDLGFTLSGSVAQRLFKIELEKSRQDITVQLKLNLNGLKIQAGDVISLTMPRYGWTSKYFEVLTWAFAVEDQGEGGVMLGVDITARETASGVFDWNSGEETAIDLSPNSNLPSPFNIPAPTSLALLSDATTLITQADGTIVQRLKVSWVISADAFVSSGGKTVIEYKKSVDSVWLEWATLTADKTYDYITDIIIAEYYDVRVRCVSLIGVFSPYNTYLSYLIPGKAAGPSAPTSVGVLGPGSSPVPIPSPIDYTGGGTMYGAYFYWTPPTDKDVAYYEAISVVAPTSTPTTPTWLALTRVYSPYIFVYNINSLFDGYCYVRAVNTSGIPGPWASGGNARSVGGQLAGTLAVQNENNAAVTGVKVGGTSSVKQTVQIPIAMYVSLAGGSTQETVNITLPSGFAYAPDAAQLACTSDSDIDVNYANSPTFVGNTSTSVYITFVLTNTSFRSVLPNTNVYISGWFSGFV